MNRKIIGAIAAIVFLAGCGSQQDDGEDAMNASDIMSQDGATITYDCGGEMIEATFNNDVEPKTADLLVVAEDAAMTLENVESASGARYSDDEVTFWTHQDQAELIMEDTGSSLMCEMVLGNE